ncbi:hypothetical protein E1267_39440 [Nonomuraea longispora]|uniref:Uncharacterized protein n=1 Tax=Nonomuraea longispora TaxID=1848320 RepID=A0A4R4MPG0_9ACTN|nr:hypothetical protein [Nonomuraea longispora]TDB97797.1 hypothetical protein E1267_39440 [Nonomuraea longispora]
MGRPAGPRRRHLDRTSTIYSGLFPAAAFDAECYNALTLTMAFRAPWASAGRLKVVNRAALWVMAVDRLVNHTATTREQVDRLVRECLSVADGAVPRSAATRFLADLRDELATVREFGELRRVWRGQLARMLAGLARAWAWRDTDVVPTLERCLDNADSRGSCFVDVSHWIYAATAGPGRAWRSCGTSARWSSVTCTCLGTSPPTART